MAIKLVHKEPRECRCDLPRRGDYIVGDVIQCTECESYFQCQGLGLRDAYKPGDETLKWEKVRKLWNGRSQKTVWEKF